MGLAAGIAAAGVAVSAGTAIAGAVGGSGKGAGGGSQQTTSSAPWEAQQPFLTNGFQSAQDVYNRHLGAPVGSYYAGQSPDQVAATQGLYNSGVQASMDYSNATNAGITLLGNSNQFTSNASNIAANGIGPQNQAMGGLLTNYAQTGRMPGQTGVNPGLTGSISNAAMGGVGSLGQSQGIANQVAANSANPNAAMDATVRGAGQYMNNGVLQGQIDAIGTDINRNLGENTLFGLHSAAQQSGNVNSSREGALDAIGVRGAQENLANAAANIRGAAYGQGAALASGQYQNAQTNALGAAGALNYTGGTAGSLGNTQASLQQQQGQFGTTSQLAAANSVNANDLAHQVANTQAQLGANAQLGSGVALGTNALNSGLQGSQTSANTALTAGNAQQAQNQAGLTAEDQRQQTLLNNYWNIVGRPLGSSGSTENTANGPGALAGGIGGLTAGAGLAKNLLGGDTAGKLQDWWTGMKTPGSDGYGTNNAGTQALQSMGFYNPLPQ